MRALWAKIVALPASLDWIVAGLLVVLFAFCYGDRHGRDVQKGEDAAQLVKGDLKRVDSLGAIRTGIAAKVAPAVARAESYRVPVNVARREVQTKDSTHLIVEEPSRTDTAGVYTPARDTVIVVPPEVTRRLAVDSLALEAEREARFQLTAQVRVDSTLIAAQAVTITDLRDALKAKSGPGWKVGAAGVFLLAGSARLAEYLLLHR